MKAVIIIEDVDDKVNVNFEFGEKGINNESYAHYIALNLIEKAMKIASYINKDEDE